MKSLELALISTILAAAVTAPLFVHHHATAESRGDEELFQKRCALLAELSADNRRLSNIVASLQSQPLPDNRIAEVLKLRNEVTRLRGTPEETDQLQHRIRRLRDQLRDAAAQAADGPDQNTALLVEETQLRQARVVRLKHWLEEMPQEKIPELKFVSEDSWIDRVDRPLITDDDYRSAIGLLRADAEQRFVPLAFNALKAFAKANNNQFPTDLSQLKPYFETPIDDAILQRYEIVPATSLTQVLAETGGDWLITQKAPINRRFDGRIAIGLTSYRGTVGEGRWDPVQ